MFLSPFDPGYDFEPPTGSALLAEIGVDRHTVREVGEDERAIRCPDRDSVLPDRTLALVFHDAPCWDCEVEPADLVVLPFPCTPYGPGEVKPHRSISSDTGSDVRPELE